MTIIDDYLDYQIKYEKEYGINTCVLMQVGYFYEAYAVDNYKEKVNNENLYRLSYILNIQLTRKNKSNKENNRGNPMMIGVQVSNVDKFVQILLDNNYTTVVIDQVTLPPEPDREITHIYSPGTDISHISKGETSNLLVIYIETIKNLKTLKNLINIGLSVIDLSVGKSIVYETISKLDDKNYSLDEVYRFIHINSPKEIVIYLNNSDFTKTELSKYFEVDESIIHFKEKTDSKYTTISYQKSLLEKVYTNRGLLSVIEYIDMEFKTQALISFVIALDFAYKHDESIIKKIEPPEFWDKNDYLILTNNSVSQLNIVSNSQKIRYNKFDSLLSVLDNTSTPLGKRKLKEVLLNPIINREVLEKRYDITDIMQSDKDGEHYFKLFEHYLNRVSDIERLHRKITLKLIQPSDFVGLDISYENIIEMIELCKTVRGNVFKSIIPDEDTLKTFYEFIEFYKIKFDLDEICKYHLDKITDSFFNKGIYNDIDNIKHEIDLNLDRFKIISKKLSHLTENNSSFVRHDSNEKEGHFIFMTQKRSQLLKKRFVNTKYSKLIIDDKFVIDPKELVFKPHTKTSVKITSKNIKDISDSIRTNREKIGDIIREKFLDILGYIDNNYMSCLKKISNFVAQIDVYKSSAKTSTMYGYTRPVINFKEESYINAKSIRHPIIERIQEDIDYVPNDISMGQEDKKGILLFGTNASGKSSLMKAMGLNIIMAQSGFFVSASEFEYCPYKYLFTRINNNDNIFKGESSFAVEMNELRGILKRAGSKSLVLGDELCSGTESISGLSIVSSCVNRLVEKKSSFMFATHLHELCKINKIKELEHSIKMYHLKVIYDTENDKLIYDRTLTEGSGNAIYGLEVCKSMDMDREFLELANSIRKEIMGINDSVLDDKQSKYNANVYIDMCGVCGENAQDVHHIKFQSCADSNNMIGHIPKDKKSNLVPLCKPCHVKVHNSDLKIDGYIQTDKGIELQFEYIEKKELENKKRNRKKFTVEQIDVIREFMKKCGKLSQKNICIKLEKENQISISANTLTKIKNNTYNLS